MEAAAPWLALITIVVLGLDALACIGPIPYIRRDLERLGCSEAFIKIIPIVKIVAVAGMVAGLWWPWIGAVATAGMVVYFFVAFGFHKRANDSLVKYIPAAAFMAMIAAAMIFSYLSAL